MKKRSKGFTLVELLVVISIIAILSVVAIIGYQSTANKANKSADKIEIEELNRIIAADAFNGNKNIVKALEIMYSNGLDVTTRDPDYAFAWNNKQQIFEYIDKKDVPFLDNEEYEIIEDIQQEDVPCQHVFKTMSIIEADCSNSGKTVSKCEKCGLMLTTSIAAIGHDYVLYLENEHPIYELDNSLTNPQIKVKLVCNKDKQHVGWDYVNADYQIITTPTTSIPGKVSYSANYHGYELKIEKEVPKASSYNWTWAFQNDFNNDGIPEMLPTVYHSKTTYTYRYKVNATDLDGYPQYEDYDYSTDEEWDFAYIEDERLYNEIVLPVLNQYGDKSQQYFDACDDYNNRINEIYDALMLKDEQADAIYQADVQQYVDTHDCSSIGTFSEKKTFTVTEDRNLCYWLHVPFDYDPNKSYPIVLFVPGEGGSINDYLNSDGTVKGNTVIPYGASWCNAFFENWYNQVKNPGEGRDKYDCFMISIYPTNSFFRGEYLQGKGTAVGIVNMHSVNGISDAHKYTEEEMGGKYTFSYYSCYDASQLSPAKDAQLCIELIDKMIDSYSIDPKRQYVLGASLGGIFTMDIISHYPHRFAAAVPVVSASADISIDNCKNLLDINVWAISGANDSNCSRFHSKLFVKSINEARAMYNPNDTHIAQYSFFPGGHSCGYIGGTLRTATEGVSITYSTQVLDFMFNSKKD